jgi:poly-gamma-glutamate synthesis protein (capsule biosynthesis protein)
LTNATVKHDKEFNFKGLPSFTNILLEGNVDAVNLANNHTFDYMSIGFEDTVSNLKDSKIGYFGYGHTLIKDIKGKKVGMLGYKCWNASAKPTIKKDITKMKTSGADIIIVSFHWGIEKSYSPNAVQTSLGRYAVDLGADLVLGHHPHVMQGIENYKGKNIVYSLGNFVYGGKEVPFDFDTFIFQQKFIFEDKRLVDSTTNIIPCSVSSVPRINNYQPIPLTDSERTRVLAKLDNLNKKIEMPTESTKQKNK